MAEQESKPVEVIVVPEVSEAVVVDEYLALTIPPNRPRKVYGGMWGSVEISAVAVSTLAILAALVAYFFFVIPSNRELAKNKSEADRLDAELISAKLKYGEITSTETQVAKLLASVDDFQTRFLPVSQNGQAALYQRLNGLIGAYGLVNTSGPDYAPLETADLNPGQQTDEERGRSKFRSLFPGVYVTVTLEGSYQNLRRFIREIETGIQDKTKLDGQSEGYVNPTVRLVNAILIDAIRADCSDIHFEPEGTFLRLRIRIDGQMVQNWMTWTKRRMKRKMMK